MFAIHLAAMLILMLFLGTCLALPFLVWSPLVPPKHPDTADDGRGC